MTTLTTDTAFLMALVSGPVACQKMENSMSKMIETASDARTAILTIRDAMKTAKRRRHVMRWMDRV